MKLSEIPSGSRLRVRVKGEPHKRLATFHHLDGSYSLCTLDGEGPEHERIFHLYHDQEMVLVGFFYELPDARSN